MAIIDNIEKLHKKPDHIKRRILLASVFVIMFIVVSVWVSTLRMTAGAGKPERQSSFFASFRFFWHCQGGVDARRQRSDWFGK